MSHKSVRLAGLKFRPQEARDAWTGLPAGAGVTLEPDPGNKFDPNAMKVMVGGHHAGFVAGHSCKEACDLLSSGRGREVVKHPERDGWIRIYLHEEEEVSR